MALRIENIGLFTAAKFPVQEHQDHAEYSYRQRLRIDGIGLLAAVKLPWQEHEEHAQYFYRQDLRIDSIGNFGESSISSRVKRSSVVRVNRFVIPDQE